MTQKWHDDATGGVIENGRSFRVGIYNGELDPTDYRDYVNIDDLLDVLRYALTATRQLPLVQITIQTWTHCKPDDPRAEWQRNDR